MLSDFFYFSVTLTLKPQCEEFISILFLFYNIFYCKAYYDVNLAIQKLIDATTEHLLQILSQ